MELHLATPSRTLADRGGAWVALTAAFAMVAVLLAPQAASGQKKGGRDGKAQKLEREGLDAYTKGNYAAAADAFEQAYEIAPNEHILFAWGQAERFRGNCRRAVELFEILLETDLSDANRNAVQASMAECQTRIAAEPGPPEKDDAAGRDEKAGGNATADEPDDESGWESSERDGEQVATAATDRDAAAGGIDAAASMPPAAIGDRGDAGGGAWYRDPVGGALTGTGVVALAVGIGLYASASSTNNAANDARSYVEFSDLKDQARSRGRLAVASISAGAALLGAGVAWYVLRSGSRDETATPGEGLSMWWDQDGAGVGFAGHF